MAYDEMAPDDSNFIGAFERNTKQFKDRLHNNNNR
jgi:hypothetical protein